MAFNCTWVTSFDLPGIAPVGSKELLTHRVRDWSQWPQYALRGQSQHDQSMTPPDGTNIASEIKETLVQPSALRPARVDVSIVMPCLDEHETLGPCLERAARALDSLRKQHGLVGELVVADNGSTDGSQDIARSHGARVIDIAERGYGAALRGGMAAAHGRYLVMGDSDSSYDFLESVPMVERLIEGFDLCMGSRFKGEIKPGAMPWKNRYIGNPVLSGILRLLFRTRIGDAHCGLRALTRDCFDRLRLTATGMEFASEMVLKAALLRCRMAEVPITLSPDKRSRPPHLRPWRDGWRHLRYMLMLSPAWLFFAPALVLGLLGTVVIGALVARPGEVTVEIGGLSFGDHWMVIASALLVLSHQAIVFGVATTQYGIVQGYRRPGRLLLRALRLARLEYTLLAGAVFLGLGLGLFGYVIVSWSSGGFGNLAMLREMITAMTLGMLGAQSVFGGFLLSIVGGNEARADQAAMAAWNRDAEIGAYRASIEHPQTSPGSDRKSDKAIARDPA